MPRDPSCSASKLRPATLGRGVRVPISLRLQNQNSACKGALHEHSPNRDRSGRTGLVPDLLTRRVIRRLCSERSLIRKGTRGRCPRNSGYLHRFYAFRSHYSLPHMANQQHYELPPQFFRGGPWPPEIQLLSLAGGIHHPGRGRECPACSEVTCERAQLADGQDILELGCGWGSLSLWMAERYPHAGVTAVSNSASQRQFIEAAATARNLHNLCVVTADMNEFAPSSKFDRIVSVEMFEHMRNYELLLRLSAPGYSREASCSSTYSATATWFIPLRPKESGELDGRYFFSGGIMPNASLLQHFDRDLKVSSQ